MTISRDSAIWWAGMIAAVITGLALNLDAFPWISETARHWITLGAAVVGIISGKLATSPLPSHREAAVQEAAKVQHKINMRKMGKPLVILALSGSLLAMTSCAKAPPSLTPVGTAAYHATQVVKALDVLRDAAIDAEAQTPKLISTDNTRKIVTFHEAAVKTIHASPGGWKPTVVAALDQLQHDILPAEWNRILPYVSLVKTLIEVTNP